MDEAVIAGIISDGGDDAVDVGVVLHLPTPGVEDAGDSETQARDFVFGGGDVVEGGGAAFKEEVVEFFGAMEAEAAELPGDGKGDEKVRDV